MAPVRAPAPRDRRRAEAMSALDNLRRIVRALRVAAIGAESVAGLTAAQLFVLQAVHAEPGCSLTEIAARTMTDRTSVAAVVERLVERGLAERRPSLTDRRRVELVATRAATAVLSRAPHAPTRRVLDGIATLDDGNLRGLSSGLAALARAMGLAEEPATMLFEDGSATAPRARSPRARPVGGR